MLWESKIVWCTVVEQWKKTSMYCHYKVCLKPFRTKLSSNAVCVCIANTHTHHCKAEKKSSIHGNNEILIGTAFYSLQRFFLENFHVEYVYHMVCWFLILLATRFCFSSLLSLSSSFSLHNSLSSYRNWFTLYYCVQRFHHFIVSFIFHSIFNW